MNTRHLRYIVKGPVLLFSKFHKMFSGYFYLEKICPDNENEHFSGWQTDISAKKEPLQGTQATMYTQDTATAPN